jgi:antitoxin component YwqK of YwqJK toxin-antitoxin module
MKRFLKYGPLIFVAVIIIGFIGPFRNLSSLRNLSSQIKITDGPRRKYYPDGKLRGEWTYKDDKLDGKAQEYHPNGKMRYDDLWRKGDLISRKEYDTNGNLVRSYGVGTNQEK